MVLERDAQVDEVEVLRVDSEEAMECFLNLASQGFVIQETNDRELGGVEIHKEEVEGVVVEKVEVWEEDERSMMMNKKSWVIQTPKKSME